MRYETHYGDRVVRCFAERPATLVAMFEETVARNPSGEALVHGATRLTWADVDLQVARRASALAHAGIGPGDRVALFLPNGLAFPVNLLAIVRLGAIAVPLGHRSRTPELRYILNHSEAVAVVFDPGLGAELPAVTETPRLRLRLSTDVWPGASWSKPLADTAGGGRDAGEDEVALLMYTSGTTGRPKGAMVTHLNLVHVALMYRYCMNLSAADRSLVAVPMSHITGIAAHIATVIRCASTLVVLETFKATDFLALAEREAVTHTVLVPAMYNLCLLEPAIARYNLTPWRVGGYGGAPMPSATIAALAERLPQLALMNCYGATETVAPVAIMPPGETAAYPDRVGRAIPGTEIIAVDEGGRELPPGEPGELWTSGPTIVRGYWNDQDATRAAFTAGFWHSGDIGSITPDGLVGVHDRKKDTINRGGYKIFAIEVENVLCGHPAVVEAAVVSKPCPVLGERVHAFVTTRPDAARASGLAAELKAFCAERLSDYKVPESFTLLDQALPRNANGKVLKRTLREELAEA
jgi:acyl-CoA synthetase (AMP-forming)/AMP-acid ligase II